MSVSRECRIVENEPGKWYLLVAMHEYGELESDSVDSVGPFGSKEEADEYLRDYFSNPGGLSIYSYREGAAQPEYIKVLISRATRPTRSLW